MKKRDLCFAFRNAILKSGIIENVHTRHMILDGQEVVWEHIIKLFKEPRRIGWSLHGLTAETVYLNSFSKMRVNLVEKLSLKSLFYIHSLFETKLLATYSDLCPLHINTRCCMSIIP